MGFDVHSLRGAGARSFTWTTWECLWDMGREFGWVPAGTVLDDEADWAGGYFSSDGQNLTGADAAAWADALERALPHLDENAASEWAKVREEDEHRPSWRRWLGDARVRDAIQFFRRGAHRIL